MFGVMRREPWGDGRAAYQAKGVEGSKHLDIITSLDQDLMMSFSQARG